MAVLVTHATTTTVADDGISPVGSNEWNANHTVLNAAETGVQMVPIPAAAMVATAGAGPTAGTPSEPGTTATYSTLDFDQTTSESAQFVLPMPKSWNTGSIAFQALWSHSTASTTFGVTWGMDAAAISDGDPLSGTFGTQSLSVDAGGTSETLYISPLTTFSVGGTPASGDMVTFRIARLPSDAADTLAADARLHAIKLFITTNAGNDA